MPLSWDAGVAWDEATAAEELAAAIRSLRADGYLPPEEEGAGADPALLRGDS